MKIAISGSIVLFKNDTIILKAAINSFLNSELNLKLYLIDNSPTENLKDIILDERVIYIHNPSNPGFGAAHNVAINYAIDAGAKFHFVINPDVIFQIDLIPDMVAFMEDHDDIGMLMPKILNEDGTSQYLPKLLPSPLSIIKRICNRKLGWFQNYIDKYELRNVPINSLYEAPILSGCFTLFRLDALKDIGLYDDKFFMYFEDWDISRRMHEKYKTVYYPRVEVIHGYESGANKSSKLFKVFVKSYFYYFSKWGWFFDKSRPTVNRNTLNQFK